MYSAVEDREILPLVMVHGGAGVITDECRPWLVQGTTLAARIGYETLSRTDSSLDAVHEAVKVMELDPIFNTGYGAALTWDKHVEMDAAIMNGSNLNCGCVSLASNILHPVDLAHQIMLHTRHKFLAGDGAIAFAIEQGFTILPIGALVTPNAVQDLDDYKNALTSTFRFRSPAMCDETNAYIHALHQRLYDKPSSVGAVAIDKYGNVAAAASSAGIIGKMNGRIGATSVLGAGIYADNTCGAVAATGLGESLYRYQLASRLLSLMRYRDVSTQEAAMEILEEVSIRFDQCAGLIAVDAYGDIGVHFTSKCMSWAYQIAGELHHGIDKGEDICEFINDEKN